MSELDPNETEEHKHNRQNGDAVVQAKLAAGVLGTILVAAVSPALFVGGLLALIGWGIHKTTTPRK